MTKKNSNRKYTAIELHTILRELLNNGFNYMTALSKQITELTKKPEEERTDQDKQNMALMNYQITMINDIIHPAHQACYRLFSGKDQFIDLCVKNQKLAVEKEIVAPCDCCCCQTEDSKA